MGGGYFRRTVNKKIIVPLIGIITLIILVIGISYAAFTYSGIGAKENVITTANISMVYNEGENGITLENAIPMEDEVGKKLIDENQIFDFTVNINIVGKTAIAYEVTAEKDNNSTLQDNEVRIYLEKSNEADNYKEILEPNKYIPLTEEDEFGAKAGEMVLDTGSTIETTTYYYRLRMWVSKEYQLGSEAKHFTIKVNVYGSDGKVTLNKPTAPTITGGSEEYALERTIKVSEEAKLASGISKYQYYLTKDKDQLTGGTWKDIESDDKSITISEKGTQYVYFRAIGENGLAGDVSNKEEVNIGKTYNITNKIENGSFENGTIDNFTTQVSSKIELSTDLKYSGNNSLKYISSEEFSSVGYKTTFSLEENHVYYATEAVYILDNYSNHGQFDMVSSGGTDVTNKPEYGNVYLGSLKIKEWNKISFHFQSSESYSYGFRLSYSLSGLKTIYFDDIMFIDLTEVFGSGNEPTKEYLDKYLKYFDGESTIIYKNVTG